MELLDFKKQTVRQELGIVEVYGRIISFIDFGNVNYWFDKDKQDFDGVPIAANECLSIGLEKIKDFATLFSIDTRFYYGHDQASVGSMSFLRASKAIFGQHKVFTKPIQKIRHDLSEEEISANTRILKKDVQGAFVYIPKCNFDVEISVDAMRWIDEYDTFCLFSSDADFVSLLHFLKGREKKTILIKGGRILHTLKESAHLIINAQDIKKHIAFKKQKPDQTGQVLADRKLVSTSRTIFKGP